ncbi:hypothetical protein ACH7BS_24160 [Klebsiella aerogenes]|uniref:hypothetical protein n=1 Tax=Klebsiella aerogenes TaxID=548 RepID=UPI0037A80580
MVSDKWLASCHRRSMSTMRNKLNTMLEQWDGRDPGVQNELLFLIDTVENCEAYLYFSMKKIDQERTE